MEEQAKTPLTGEVAGSATAVQLPNVPCSKVNIKAVRGNSGNVYLGSSDVTKVDGVGDATTGFELDAGEETGWLWIDNLNKLWLICDNAGDDLIYLAFK